MSVRRENPAKTYVKVRADHLLDGPVRPLMIRSEDGPIVRIDRVLDIRQAASLKAGGQGVRYICEAAGQQLALFFEDPYWFIETEALSASYPSSL